MIQWKERLYAFLIRKFVGPWLNKESWQRLYQSIDVSLQDGIFVLRDVSLATNKLTALARQPVRIRKASVEKLEIRLNLQEHQQEQEQQEQEESSLAWRAWKLGSSHTPGAVSVVVQILVEGICIEVEPDNDFVRQAASKPFVEVEGEAASASKGMFASYMEAVLASLRLSVEVHNLEIKLYSPKDETTSEDWVAVRIKSLSYHDTNQASKSSSQVDEREYETIMQKSLDLQRVSVVVGSAQAQDTNFSTMVALLEGNSRLRVRVVEYRTGTSAKPNPIQHDIEVSLGQKFNVLVDENTVLALRRITQSYTAAFQKAAVESNENVETKSAVVAQQETTEDDRRQIEEDMETLDAIMRQYNEARRLAERQQIRGGILIPNEDDSNNMTYDAFFDANDQSIYRYSTMMSHALGNSTEKGGGDFVHLKARLFLKSGSFKLAFGARKLEYMLATFSDLDANASLSSKSSAISLRLLHLDIEESFIVPGTSARPRTEISRVLHFVTSEDPTDGDTLDQGELLLTSPCITVDVQVAKQPDRSQIVVNLEPMQLSCHPVTISNLSLFANTVSPPTDDVDTDDQAPDSNPQNTDSELSITLSCPSVDVLLPMGTEEKFDVLFERCGYVGDDSLFPPTSISLGIHVDSPYITYERGTGKSANLSCNHIVGYVAAPSRKRSRTTQCMVVDLLSMSGASHSLTLSIQMDDAVVKGEPNHAVKAFPLAPTIASFKARQEDEDEENQIDRVLLSKMGNLGIAAKRELRGKDPQREMLQNCQKCQTSILLRIPQISFDMTADECAAIIGVLGYLKRTENNDEKERIKDARPTVIFAVSFECDRASLGIHHGRNMSANQKETGQSFVWKIRRLQTHAACGNSGMSHLRLAAQEIDFLEARNLAAGNCVKDPRSSEARSTAIFQRLKSTDCSAQPIMYRSHLFKPLSRESPSILVDLLFRNEDSTESEATGPQSLHCTIYDITYRHLDDSTWMDDLKSTLNRLSPKNDKDISAPVRTESSESLTRVFLAIADCNIDYSTPTRFKNSARMLLRLGDMRCSSNIVLPTPSIQAYNVSIADLSLCLCSDRHPHNFENSMLIDSEMLFVDKDCRHAFLDAAEAVKDMNYRTMVLLDTMDAVIAVANLAQPNKNIPKIYASLTLGELSLFGSKDSFWLLVQAIGEAVGEATAVSDSQIDVLKEKSEPQEVEETFFDSVADAEEDEAPVKQPAYVNTLDSLQKQSALRPAIGTKSSQSQKHQFLLDGYDWTTIDQAESTRKDLADDEEQSARWYHLESDRGLLTQCAVVAGPGVSLSEEASKPLVHPVRIIPHHFPLRPDNDPLADGDMGAAKYAGTSSTPLVSSRVLVHDMKLKLRLFDGYDWPELLSPEALNKERNDSFLIDSPVLVDDDNEEAASIEKKSAPQTQKSKLMADLLGDSSEPTDTFRNVPLPEEKGARLIRLAKCRRLARRAGTYFQISASGICLRNDSFQLPSNHRLVSCLNLKAQDFFIAETISGNKPVKMVGEWFSEAEHPRDSRDGLLMMKMVTWAPQRKITDENEIANDECEAVIKVLPLRCLLDQKAIRFATTFFRPDSPKNVSLPKGLHAVPPPKVRLFRFKPFRLKVDYKPEKVNHQALRDGAIVELINFSPLHSMVLTLQQVEVLSKTGFGDVASVLTKSWIGDICSTQIVKFLTNARPFEPITTISGGVADMVVLPWEAIKNGDSLQRSLRSGAKSFASAVAYEALTITSGIAEFMATTTAAGTGSRPILPSRPDGTPRGVTDTAPHALESIARGFQEANYKIVIIPYREYQRHGTTGALKSVLKGIPVALAAPTSGAAEALSFALLGIRNQMRPDIRKEEEVNQRGLRLEDA